MSVHTGKIRYSAGALVFALTLSRGTVAQVNVEGLRKQVTKQGLFGKLSGSITSYRGNTLGTELGASAFVAYQRGPNLAYLSANGAYTRLSGTVSVANAFAHLRYNRMLDEWFSVEAFVQGESDRFRQLELRTLLGLGPRFLVLDEEWVSLYYGSSYMYEHNEVSDGVVPVRPANVHRWNNYGTVVIVLDENRASISNTFYYQPRFDDFSDARLLDIFALDVSIVGRISAGLQATVRYENPVPRSIKRTDLTIKNTLGVIF